VEITKDRTESRLGPAEKRHAAFTAVPPPPPSSFLLPSHRLYIAKNGWTYTRIRLHRNYIWITAATKYYCEWNIFTQIKSGEKSWRHIYHWAAGLAVTGRIRDTVHNVSQSSFQVGSSISPSYFHNFLLTAFLEKAFIRNTISRLRINYINMICINNNAVIKSDSWKTPRPYFCYLKFPLTC
jgi:hypothetical protein